MIAVSAAADEMPLAEEFFELFKTPWEPVVPGRSYRVVLDTTSGGFSGQAQCLLAYGSRAQAIDREVGSTLCTTTGPLEVDWRCGRLPIYGSLARFVRPAALVPGQSYEESVLGYRHRHGCQTAVRVGYDLFREVRTLLTTGQPSSHAQSPTLDRHIELLRALLLDSGVPVVEVPPVPSGHDFICCLTHDIDFVGIRRHGLDLTLAGFSARASVGTLRDCLAGRRPSADLVRNWAALVSLPLVFAGIAPDPWRPFDDYQQADGGRPSTFFVIPFKERPGTAPDGHVESRRAAPYGAADIVNELQEVRRRGHEIALHGIDAWRQADAGRAEGERLSTVTGVPASGVRMHWLYFGQESPRELQRAGFLYDSTWGYNDAIGYRAGTTQPFRFPGCDELLELPLAIMDTAMFYPDRMGLTPGEAVERCLRLVSHAKGHGGVLVINWHDRSLAPERLWGRSYHALLDAIGDQAWFTTAADAAKWFRWRRSMKFRVTGDAISVSGSAMPPGAHGARVRLHVPGESAEAKDVPLTDSLVTITL